MTPRQLMALADAHREFEGGGRGARSPERRPPSRPASTQGSAGWLMAVAQSLEQGRSAPRANAPTG